MANTLPYAEVVRFGDDHSGPFQVQVDHHHDFRTDHKADIIFGIDTDPGGLAKPMRENPRRKGKQRQSAALHEMEQLAVEGMTDFAVLEG